MNAVFDFIEEYSIPIESVLAGVDQAEAISISNYIKRQNKPLSRKEFTKLLHRDGIVVDPKKAMTYIQKTFKSKFASFGDELKAAISKGGSFRRVGNYMRALGTIFGATALVIMINAIFSRQKSGYYNVIGKEALTLDIINVVSLALTFPYIAALVSGPLAPFTIAIASGVELTTSIYSSIIDDITTDLDIYIANMEDKMKNDKSPEERIKTWKAVDPDVYEALSQLRMSLCKLSPHIYPHRMNEFNKKKLEPWQVGLKKSFPWLGNNNAKETTLFDWFMTLQYQLDGDFCLSKSEDEAALAALGWK
jgi:hypothetical protein